VRGPRSEAARGLPRAVPATRCRVAGAARPARLACVRRAIGRTLTLAAPVAWAAFLTTLAHADVGDTADALPGVVRVPVAGAIERTGFAFAEAAGYGFTEGVLHDDDTHHRAFGSLAGSWRPIPLFALGLQLDGRYDTSTGPGGTSGWVGDPRVALRVGGPLGQGWALGGQLGVWLPGGSAPSVVFGATTPDASVLGSYTPPGTDVTIASRAGFRWDNSTKSISDPDRLAPSDRLALGLDQASAALLGLGVAAKVSSRVELTADATWDLLVGSGAPQALDSPIVTSAGARITLDAAGRWQIQAVATASPSKRPPVTAGSPLVDVEPLVGAFIALVLRPAGPQPLPPPVEPPAPAPAPPVALVAAPVRASVRGSVFAEDGHAAVAQAHVSFKSASGAVKEAATDASGAFAADDLDPGEATVDVTADGFQPATRTITLSEATPALDVPLVKALPVGQVRGLVRDYGGKAVAAATVRVEPVGVDVHVGADGMFEANVAPGSYEVVIRAKGYAEQRRRVTVERDGVTMLNVELRKGP
jgi:hypothetical protein